MNQPIIFGVRHLSPSGAWHLLKLLNRVRPRLVLVEGPSDFTSHIKDLTAPETKPPVAFLAYTQAAPIRTILYPLAEYSPEYQAIGWCVKNNCACRFIDLPSSAFLALASAVHTPGEDAAVYRKLDELSGEDDYETFWEHLIEHSRAEDAYLYGAREFGEKLRELTQGQSGDWAETVVRESYMKRQIADAISEGYAPEEIVVVTGAYHVAGLLDDTPPMDDKELASLPSLPANQTLMPYSFYRLSSRSGYGAGNKAPAYYSLLWQGLQKDDLGDTAYQYLSRLAAYQRLNGNLVSSAEVIEAARLASALASLHGYSTPSLHDLRDAAVTCMGHGNFSEIALAAADTEIGTQIGSLPDGVSRTSIQADFYRLLKDLRLEKYKSAVTEELALDLREKLTVKSEKAAFLDLERSFFLHKLRVLGIHFAAVLPNGQSGATWAEAWNLQWTPEAEIEIVENALRGDTVAQAASFALKERLEGSAAHDTGNPADNAPPQAGIAQAAAVIEDAFLCGMPESVEYATAALQGLAADAAAVSELAKTAASLSAVLRYGSIRKLDPAPLEPVLSQLFLRASLLMEESCICDNNAIEPVMEAMDTLNQVSIHHAFLDSTYWLKTLKDIADRDDLNTKASGFAAGILLEQGEMDDASLATEVQRRLSKGVPADLGAGWFEGLSRKNHYALIARLSLWRELSAYLDTLDNEEFKRALLFLRRAFADFTAKEKSDIAENLGEIWELNVYQVSETLNQEISAEEKELLQGLDEFDFGDI